MAKIIVANWKMNPASPKEAEKLFAQAQTAAAALKDRAKVVICPPFVYLPLLVSANEKSVKLGAQDCFWQGPVGAYTGEISPLMLKKIGVEYVITGHSERRANFAETDEIINKKISAALKAGLKVILCVGENPSVRNKGKKAAEKFVEAQLKNGLKNIKPKKGQLIIAYEPVWAIGTGKSCNPDDAGDMSVFIKKILNSANSVIAGILYGGSVNSKNISGFLKHKEIDGALVGGASINSKEFSALLEKI